MELILSLVSFYRIAIWTEWRATHPKDFQRAKDDMSEKVGETTCVQHPEG